MGLVVHTSAFTAHSSVILGKLWFVGNFNSNIGKREHSWVWGWGIRYPCHWRARSLGSKRPSEIFRRRGDVLSDHISGYVEKTLVFEKKGYKDDRKWKFLYSIATCRYQLGLVSHRTPPSLGSSRPMGCKGTCMDYKPHWVSNSLNSVGFCEKPARVGTDTLQYCTEISIIGHF